MLKETISYVDYDGNERTEDHYFNITKAELLDLETKDPDGWGEKLMEIVRTKDTTNLIKVMKELVLFAYGEKSSDGRKFIKVDKDGHRLADDFVQTEAYSEFYMSLLIDAKKASDFFNAVIPDISELVEKAKANKEIATITASN